MDTPCGTYAGYQQHLRRYQPSCDPCNEARRAYQRAYRSQPRPPLTPYQRGARVHYTVRLHAGVTYAACGRDSERSAYLFTEEPGSVTCQNCQQMLSAETGPSA